MFSGRHWPEWSDHEVDEADSHSESLEAVIVEMSVHVTGVYVVGPHGGLEERDQGDDDERQWGDQALDEAGYSDSFAQTMMVFSLKLPEKVIGWEVCLKLLICIRIYS